MKKIININLYGRVIPIEDAAYDSLQRYIESLRRYFATEEGRDEIINDIESRISELMNDKIKKGATAVTEADMAEIIGAMGRVEDFEAADRESATTDSSASSSASNGAYQPFTKTKGRLYRNENDKFLGGVCSGLAAYMNVDPTVVRLLFAIITFGGFGTGVLIYILMWIILPAGNITGYMGKRLFRNPDDQMLGGVCGGLAAYFGKSTKLVRLIFAAPILLSVLINVLNGIFNYGEFHFGFSDFAFAPFISTFVVVYIVLWIVLPLARTPYDKMEMRGEKVDVNRIRQNVQDSMGDIKGRARDFGEEVKATAQNLSTHFSDVNRNMGRAFAGEVGTAARNAGSGIGHVIGVLFKSFVLFCVGVAAFAFFVVVLAFVFGGVAKPVNTFLLDGFWHQASMWGTIIFFLAVPLIAILTWVIRRIAKVKSQNRYLGWTFGGLWAIGWVCLPIFISGLVRDFKYTERVETPINLYNPAMNKLVVDAPAPAIRYSGNFSWITDDNDDGGFDLTDDSLKLSNVRIEVEKSEDSFYHITMYRYAAGKNRNLALQRAEHIAYTATTVDSVLRLGSGFGIGAGDKYRAQKVLVEIQVPVGKQIRFNQSVGQKLNPWNIRVSDSENYNRRRNWGRRNYEFEWDQNYGYNWEADADYYMKADGKLWKVGVPENKESNREEDDDQPDNARDSMRRVMELRRDSMNRIIDSLEGREEGEELREDVLTGMNNTKATYNTPMPLSFVPTLF